MPGLKTKLLDESWEFCYGFVCLTKCWATFQSIEFPARPTFERVLGRFGAMMNELDLCLLLPAFAPLEIDQKLMAIRVPLMTRGLSLAVSNNGCEQYRSVCRLPYDAAEPIDFRWIRIGTFSVAVEFEVQFTIEHRCDHEEPHADCKACAFGLNR